MDLLGHPVDMHSNACRYTRMSHPALSNQHFFSHVQVNARLGIRDKGRPSQIGLSIVCYISFVVNVLFNGNYSVENFVERNSTKPSNSSALS